MMSRNTHTNFLRVWVTHTNVLHNLVPVHLFTTRPSHMSPVFDFSQVMCSLHSGLTVEIHQQEEDILLDGLVVPLDLDALTAFYEEILEGDRDDDVSSSSGDSDKTSPPLPGGPCQTTMRTALTSVRPHDNEALPTFVMCPSRTVSRRRKLLVCFGLSTTPSRDDRGLWTLRWSSPENVI